MFNQFRRKHGNSGSNFFRYYLEFVHICPKKENKKNKNKFSNDWIPCVYQENNSRE